ncbi:MAG: M23 family metallopeptidase [Candidatus Hydrogenedentota bacterium]
MKRWTVMLIPHDRGGRRSFEFGSIHLWLAGCAFVVLAFFAGLFYQRDRLSRSEADRLREYSVRLEQDHKQARLAPVESALDRAAVESAVRAQYEARDATLTAELSRLYELETEVREMTGLRPREGASTPLAEGVGGQGGGGAYVDESIAMAEVLRLRPPQFIQGLSRPSADLILQEIRIREASLRQLLGAMNNEQDRVSRVPSILPSTQKDLRLTSRFGNRRDPFNGRLQFHSGLDIGTTPGTPVLATAKGVVKSAERDGAYGNLVVVDHGNGIETLYGHMSQILVTPGQEVDRDQQIGKVGSTGRSTSPHIHYEVLLNGRPVDPQRYIGH